MVRGSCGKFEWRAELDKMLSRPAAAVFFILSRRRGKIQICFTMNQTFSISPKDKAENGGKSGCGEIKKEHRALSRSAGKVNAAIVALHDRGGNGKT